MKDNQYEKWLKTYGANLDLWPHEPRRAFEKALSQGLIEQSLMQAEMDLDKQIQLWHPPSPTKDVADLKRELLSNIQSRIVWHWLEPLTPKIALLSLSLFIGLYFGFSIAQNNQEIYFDHIAFYGDDMEFDNL